MLRKLYFYPTAQLAFCINILTGMLLPNFDFSCFFFVIKFHLLVVILAFIPWSQIWWFYEVLSIEEIQYGRSKMADPIWWPFENHDVITRSYGVVTQCWRRCWSQQNIFGRAVYPPRFTIICFNIPGVTKERVGIGVWNPNPPPPTNTVKSLI